MNRSEASRHNGAKSKGPVTPEGKQKSARNARSHGLFSSEVVASNESREAFEELLADYVRRYAPQGEAEKDLVEEIAASRWRLRRIARMEAALIDEAILTETELLEADGKDEPERAESRALACIAAGAHGLPTLHRYESRLRRQYEKAAAELARLQAGRTAPEQQIPVTTASTKRTREDVSIETLIARFIEPPTASARKQGFDRSAEPAFAEGRDRTRRTSRSPANGRLTPPLHTRIG